MPGEESPKETYWELFVDGSSTGGRSGTGVVLISSERHIFCEMLPFDFKASNNEAEYKSLIVEVRMTSGFGIPNLKIHSNSQLVIN